MRYGQRFQAEKNNAQQSLFGGGGQVDIQRPVLPACADWTRGDLPRARDDRPACRHTQQYM